LLGLIKKLFYLALLLSALLTYDIYSFLHQPMSVNAETLYEFSPGSSVTSLAHNLYRDGLSQRKYYIQLYTRLSGKSRKLKAGEYFIRPGVTPYQLLLMMEQGKVKQYSLTLIEGYSFRQMLQLVQQSKDLKHELAGLPVTEVMARIGHVGEHPEGRFYPDTYHFPKGLSDVEFLKRAYNEMEQRLDNAWQNRDPGLPFKTPYEALIMASIVEKESALAEERTRIAGVFINRLRKGMRLQTDPTVIYGIGESYDGDIRFKDLRRDNPYNTYTRKGLPPTPIAMPGQGAIDAVMNPDTTDYLYFVARGDASGSHVFSTTLVDHEKAVDKFQRKRKKK